MSAEYTIPNSKAKEMMLPGGTVTHKKVSKLTYEITFKMGNFKRGVKKLNKIMKSVSMSLRGYELVNRRGRYYLKEIK